MQPYPSGSGYFRDPREIAQALGLTYLGSLAAEPRVQELTGSLAGLAPDPRFSERLFRFVTGDLPLIWVVGLGDAGEEIPVAVGLAARAATKGVAPVLVVRPGEIRYPGSGDLEGRPVEAGAHFGEALAVLSEGPWTAAATGIQGVYRAWQDARPEGDALWPAALVVAAGSFAGDVAVPPQASHVLLVIPFRDLPRERIEAAVEGLASVRERVVGFVAYGSLGDGASEGSEERAAAHGAFDADAVPLPAPSPVAAEAPSGPAEIQASQAWSDAFGPRPGPRFGRGTLLGAATGLVVIAAAIAGVWLTRPALLFGARPAGPPPITPARSEALAGSGASEGASEGAGSARPVPPGETALALPAATDSLDAAGDGDEGGFWVEVEVPGAEAEPRSIDAPAVPVADEPRAGASARGVQDPRVAAEAPAAQEPRAELETPLAGAARVEPERPAAPEPRVEPERPAAQEPRVEPEAAAARAPRAERPDSGADIRDPNALIRDMVPARDGPFAVLCGSFLSVERAASEVARLAAAGHPARRVAVRIPDRGVWQRVLVGEFVDEGQALALAQALVAAQAAPTCQVVAAGGYGMVIGRPVTSGGS